MSGVARGVKKVFSKVGRVLKKIIKPVVIATAAYFSLGLALSYIPATSAFAASMPGFAGGGILGTGVGAGATAGAGVFSKAAAAFGVGGGLASGAVKAGATAAELTGTFGAQAAVAATGGAPTATALSTVAGTTAGASATGMSLTNKLLLAKVGVDTAGALFGPSPEEEYAAQYEEANRWRGAFYGASADGSTAPPPTNVSGPAPPALSGPETQPASQPTSVTPEQQRLLDGREKRGLFATNSETPGIDRTGVGQMKTQLPIPEGLFSSQPGVRYV